MEVVFNKQVLNKIDEYAQILTQYPISSNRIVEKIEKLKSFLFSLGTSIYVPPVCRYKDLGQIFDANKNPLNKNLKQISYSDESGSQWIFSCHYDESNDIITIVKMLASKQIKEEYHNQVQFVLEFLERMRRIE